MDFSRIDRIDRIEWAGAQELLVKLVQILIPLTQGGEGKGMPSLSQRLYVPPSPSGKENPFPYRVRLLTTLHQAQKQMDRWIEILSDAGLSARSALPAEKGLPSAAEKDQIQPAPKGAAESSPSKAPVGPKREAAKGQPVQGRAQKVPSGSPVPVPVPVQGQAQKLIDQVRAAIQSLSSFSNLEDPKALPLREAMKKLKPMIDELIEAVGRGDMHSSDDGAPPSYTARPRNAVPIPGRQQQVFSKQFPLPRPGWVLEKKTETPQAKTFSSSLRQEKGVPVHSKPDAPRTPVPERPDGQGQPRQPQRAEKGGKSPESKRELKQEPKSSTSSFQRSLPSPQPPMTSPYFPITGRSPSPKEREKDPPDRFERIAIPGSPYSSQTLSPPPVKTKKKRKGFWTRDEDKDEDPLP